MTVQDSEKNLQQSKQVGIITTKSNNVTSQIFSEKSSIQTNVATQNILFNGSNSIRHFELEISCILSPGGQCNVTLNSPNVQTPLTMYSKSLDKTSNNNQGFFKNLKSTLIPGASLNLSVQNASNSTVDNLFVHVKEVRSESACKSCKTMFGLPDKYTKAFIVLMLVAIFVVLVFEFLTFKKEEKV